MIYYEDYEIGVVRRLGSVTLSKEEIVDFARQFDPQPFHIDEAAAKASIFGGLTASSCHTFALTGLINAHNPEKSAVVANLGADGMRFPEPVRPGDTITMTSECKEKRVSKSRPQLGIVGCRTALENQHGDVVMEVLMRFMVQRRPEGDG